MPLLLEGGRKRPFKLKVVIRWRPLAFFGIAFLGLALRLYGLDWDQMQERYRQLLRLYGADYALGNNFHPDERQILFHVVQLSWPHSLAQFFDAAASPLNPHFFAYGTFPLYLLAMVGNILSHISPTLANFATLTLTGRVLNAFFDTGTILLTGWLGLLLTSDRTPGRRYAWSVALLAAALVAFTPLQLQLSHFYTVDTMLLFFVTLTILACVILVDSDKPVRWSLIAGLGFGLALATKFSAAPLAVPLFVALAMRWYRHGIFSILEPLIYSLSATLVSFLIAMPYAFLDRTEFIQQVAAQGDLARGLLDLPYVRQFAGTTPFIYQAQNMLLWGMGLTLGLAAIAGFLWLCWRVWKRDAGPWLVVLSWVIVYGAITGSFYVKFMRYMLPLYPFLTLMAASVLIALLRFSSEGTKSANSTGHRSSSLISGFVKFLPYVLIVIVLAGTIFQGLALLNVYSQPNTHIQASRWIFDHLKPGSVLTYEQWDDALPVAIDNHDASIYKQASYVDASGHPQQGLDLYGDDTTAKAQQLAQILPTVDAITMASDRLDTSIPRLPCRYPLTIHYYQLLFSGQLGFHLAAQFENHPNLLGITLNDSHADESYFVFDHPRSRIFVRDNPYPYTSEQLFHKLLQGVQLPPSCASLSGAQRSLLLNAQQIADDQQSPPFGVQFPAGNLSNTFPIFVWWLALMLSGVLAYPLVFAAFRGLTDRGYIFSKTLGILLLAYSTWILAYLHLVAFSHLSTLIVMAILLLLASALCVWQRQTIKTFLLQRWRLLLIEEAIFTLAFLLFVGIRSLNPDLWHIYFGGEKPMELAFLNAVLRSPYMPPYDPWFAGGYINYYYWPFYATYQQLYVNGLELVNKGTGLNDYLTISGLWIFITLSFFLLELYRWWARMRNSKANAQGRNTLSLRKLSARYLVGYLLLCGTVLTLAALLGLKILLALLIVLGVFLCFVRMRDIRLSKFDAETRFTYILLLAGLCISLGLEIVYVRDFLDGGDYERMNTVFKFSIQAWLCFAIGGALAVQRLWSLLRGYVRKVWIVIFFLLVLGGSIFLTAGTASRIRDHQVWEEAPPPAQSANYTPTLDGLAFIRAWFPGDASAIA